MIEIDFIAQITLAISVGYMFLLIYLLSAPEPKKGILKELPIVSILVAYRNEETNILSCLEALDQINYPNHKLEIILLNDQSTDQSPKIVQDFLANKNRFNHLDIVESNAGLKGKMNALAQGIEQSTGEFIFITDADCKPHTNWIRTMLGYFDSKIGLVSGFTLIQATNSDPFNNLQATDWLFLQSLANASSNVNKLISVIGNNLAFRREAYDSVGGYEKIGFSITEDHALMKAIENHSPFNVRYIQDDQAVVISKPVDGFWAFLKQRKRWAIGGLTARPIAYLIVGVSFFAHLSIPIIFSLQLWSPMASISIGSVIGIDLILIKRASRNFGLEYSLSQFLLFELFYIFYPIILIVTLPFSRKVIWKGREY